MPGGEWLLPAPAPAFRHAAAPTRIISRPAPECIQAGGKALYWNECAEHLLPACARLRRRPTGARKAGGQATQGGGAMQHAGLTPSTLCCSIGCQQLCCTGVARREVFFLLNPDFYETQPQKPHNKPKKTQIMLREKRLRPELKLGGQSDNPTSKGIP